jgi:hypothetical protein
MIFSKIIEREPFRIHLDPRLPDRATSIFCEKLLPSVTCGSRRNVRYLAGILVRANGRRWLTRAGRVAADECSRTRSG